MDEITERDSTYTFNADYWHDDLPTAEPDAQALIDALNADAYAQQIEAMVHERQPLIAAWMRVNAYYVKHNARHAKQYGALAQALFNETRAQIEREAGVYTNEQ